MKTIILSIYSFPDDDGLGDKEVNTLGDILDFAASQMNLRPSEVEILYTDGGTEPKAIPWSEWQKPAIDYFDPNVLNMVSSRTPKTWL